MVNRSTATRVALLIAVPVIAIAAVIITFAATDEGSTSRAAPSATGTSIEIKNFSFAPTPLSAKPGATITITNSDDTTHTVTAKKRGAFDTGDIQGSGTSTITLPTTPGTYAYFCDIHNYMRGVIRVAG
jgi:plastocyanin